MRARARIVAQADGRGGTRLAVLRGEAPLLLRRTGHGPGVTVHLVGGAAGPLGGDDLRLDVEVGPGADLDMRSVAASLALPGPPGTVSRMHVRATVAAGATLRWWPEPQIAAAGCDHDAVTEVRVAAGGALLWRDDIVCGRHGETPGNLRIVTTIGYADRTLYRHELALGPAAPGWSGAAVLGGGRAIGTVVLIDPAWVGDGPPPARVLGPDAALMPLAGPGVLATAVGTDTRRIAAALDPLCDPASPRFPRVLADSCPAESPI
jgi:urease accessory protein